MSKVNIKETLLKQYKDKELISFVVNGMKGALVKEYGSTFSAETVLASKLKDLEFYLGVLAAVDSRMNKDSKEINIVL